MTATELRTQATHDLDATLRLLPAVADAINQLTKPRIIHTEIRDDGHGGITGIHTEQHPPLIDLLEHGTGSTNRGRSSGIRIPIDAEAHELLKEIRGQVRQWLLFAHHSTTPKDLKSALRRWAVHHANAVHRGHIAEPEHRAILRKLDGWVDRIDAKYDPDTRLEYTKPCPAILRNAAGDTYRCGKQKALIEGELKAAIDLNISRHVAHCRACGTTWEGERGLLELGNATDRWEQEQLRDLVEEAT
jgi:hypothetical protein